MSELLQTSHATLSAKARTFSLASRFLPRRMRDDAAIVYAFCRAVDDTADERSDELDASLALTRLQRELAGGEPARPLVAAFRAVVERLEIPLDVAHELIEGVRSDLGPVRIADEAELLRYCYRVGSTVGLMMCGVLGVHQRAARPFAVDLGVAMQLTNIVRDVAEDARADRVYLPRTVLQRAGVTPEEIFAGNADRARLSEAVAELVALAETYYRSADDGMRYIDWRPRQAILVASRVYRAICLCLERRCYDSLEGRVVVTRGDKTLWTLRALLGGLRPHMLGLRHARPHDAGLHVALAGLPGTNAGPSGFSPLRGRSMNLARSALPCR